jgi:hypothetical protein
MNFNDLNDIEGLQFIPVGEFKNPTVNNWHITTKKYDLSNTPNVGLVCGVPSGNLEALDFDLKYDLTGTLFERYKKEVSKIDATLLNKMVVQKTKSGGYHFLYRCRTIVGNSKLANRKATIEEKQITYDTTYAKSINGGMSESDAKKEAQKYYENDKVRVLIETRGIKGQVVVAPSKGYDFIFGDLLSISEITPEQRDILFTIARSFNQVVEEVKVPKKEVIQKTKGLSVFDDYNQRGDVVALLENHGWKVVSQKGSKTHFLRPGQTTSLTSGNFDSDKNWFSVFTTSSEFEPETAYLPYAVYAVLECSKNYSEASRKLFDLGYGERDELPKKNQQQSTRVIQSRIDVEDNDYSFLASAEDYDGYLQMVKDGTLPQGLTTGSPLLDEYFLFKEGNFVNINGIDNTGKTSFMLWLLLLAAMYHGWRGIIFASENTIGSCMRKLIQFYWGKQLHGKFAMNENEYGIAKTFIEKHFIMIKAQEDLYNYKDIINMVKKARKKYKLNYGMIDPYNALKIDLSGFSKLSTHEYHYEALSELKAYGQQTKFGWFINHHAVTAAARAKDGEKKYPVAPQKADTEGGNKTANKSDDFLTIHRVTQHPTDWMVTEVHVRKIKETETGGRPTPHDMPVLFEMYKGGTAFLERLIEGGKPTDPVHSWHLRNEPKQENISFEEAPVRSINSWLPYKDDNGETTDF